MQTLFGQQRNAGVRRWVIFGLLVLLPILLIVLGYVAFARFRGSAAKAEREVEVFRQRVATEQYAVIYGSASSALRGEIDQDRFTKRLAAIHSKMGACSPSPPRTFFVNSNTKGTTVKLQYVTNCSGGVLNEAFSYLIVGTGAQLARYDASSAFQ